MRFCTGGAGTTIYRFPFFFNDFRIKPISQNQHVPAVLVRRFFQSESGKPLAFQKFGFNDRFSVNELVHLIKTNKVPPLTLVYFPDLDQHVHKHGRNDAAGVAKADRHVQKILDSFPSWEAALKDHMWIVMGDNGQAWISGNKKKH